MQAIALLAASAVGTLVRQALRLPVGQLLLVMLALVLAPAIVGPAIAAVLAVLRLVYAAVWLWWRYFAPAASAPAGG